MTSFSTQNIILMRIFTLFILSFLISATLSAQEKGQLLIGGTLGFNKNKSENLSIITKSTTFSLAPSFGKFYRKNRLAGVSLNYSHTSFNDKELNRNSYAGGFFLRQYQPLGKSFYLFAEEGISGYSANYSNLYTSGPNSYIKIKDKSANLYFFPGIAYGINKKLQLEIGLPQLLTLGYSFRSYDYQPNKNSESNFYLNSGFSQTNISSLTFGIRWMIAR